MTQLQTSLKGFTHVMLLLHLCVPTLAAAQPSVWQVRFEKTWKAALAAEKSQEWEKALRLYSEVQQLLPRESTTLISRARCLSRLRRQDESLKCLQQAVESGWTQDTVLREDPAFDQLRKKGAFRKLIKRMNEIKQERILLYVPPTVDPTKPAPLIIAFHGRNENPHYSLPSWKEASDTLAAVVVAPRGMHRRGENLLHVWEDPRTAKNTSDIDLPACAAIAREAITLAERKCRIDPRRIVLAGYSQGGAVALALLGKEPDRYVGAFAQASLRPPRDKKYWESALGGRQKRVFLIAGELDHLRSHSERASADLRAAGLQVRYEVIPGVGHEPPEDNVRRQVEAIRFVLGEGRRPDK